MKKVVDTILVLAMLASYVPGLAEDIVQEGLQESGRSKQAAASGEETDPPAAPEKPLPSATQPDSYDAVMNVTMDTELTGEMVASTGTDENTIHVSSGTLTVSGAAITRTSEDSSDGELAYGYGVGAALLVTGGTAEISGSTVTTDSPGGTGLYAYGDGTIRAADTVVDTIRAGAGGVHAAAGSMLRADNLNVHTRGERAGALLVSGGAQAMADGGSYLTEGAASPAAEVTGEVIVHGAQLTAAASEALRMSGGQHGAPVRLHAVRRHGGGRMGRGAGSGRGQREYARCDPGGERRRDPGQRQRCVCGQRCSLPADSDRRGHSGQREQRRAAWHARRRVLADGHRPGAAGGRGAGGRRRPDPVPDGKQRMDGLRAGGGRRLGGRLS